MKPYKILKVNKWISNIKKKVYIFNSEIDDKEKDKDFIYIENINIYSDDNIEDAINKISLAIKEYDLDKNENIFPVYSWSNKKPILFDIIDNKWNGYSVNPLESTDRKNKILKENINYNFKYNELFDYDKIDIIFSNVIEDLKDNKYYFIERKIDTYQEYLKRNNKLLKLKNYDDSFIKKNSEIYHRIDLQHNFKSGIINLSHIFNLFSTSKDIPLAQYVIDINQIYYKLYKYHTLNIKTLTLFTDVNKINKNKILILYSIISDGCYCKIIIDDKSILFSYFIYIRYSITWDKYILPHINKITKILESVFQQPIKFKELSLNFLLNYSLDNIDASILTNGIGEYIDIFHVNTIIKEKNKYKISCVYKRSSNYNKNKIDIADYIKSRVNLGIPKQDIILELINLGIKDAENIVEIEMDNLEKYEEHKIVKESSLTNSGTIVIIELIYNGFNVSVLNLPNRKELEYLNFWLSKILATSRNLNKKYVKTPIATNKDLFKEIVPQIIKNDDKKQLASSSSSSSSGIKSVKGIFDNEDNFDLEMEGGALGKEKHSYFMNMLQLADKQLFGENYSRNKCQAIKQPVVLSKENKDKLEKEGRLNNFDNYIEYGSSPSNKNFYACPRKWCPISKIPLNPNDEKDKCPLPDEEPMEMYWDNDKERKRYVKLIKPNERGMCVPCCLKKEPDPKEQKTCFKYLGEKDNSESKKEKEKENDISDSEDDEKGGENYLINHDPPLPLNRYGLVGKSLYDLLFPKISYNLCSKNLNKSTKCLVRKGVIYKKVKKDSLLNSISYLLGFESKKYLINDIIKKISITNFLSFENGNICRSFLDYKKDLINDKKFVNLFLSSLTKKDFELFDISFDDNKQLINNYKNIRLLNIFYSFTKFINYLSSDDYPTEKYPYYLYTLLTVLYNVLLVIWEKDNITENVSLVCPFYISYEDLLNNLDSSKNVIMLLKNKNKNFYEPLELKVRNKESEKTIEIDKISNLKKILSECKNNKIYDDVYSDIITLNNWINTKILKNNIPFVIKYIIVNDNMTINHFMTSGNILIKLNEIINISYLENLIKNFKKCKVLFYDDIINNKYKINVLSSDYKLFTLKCNELNMKIDIGTLREGIKEDDMEYYSILQIEDNNILNEKIIINTPKMDDIKNYYEDTKINNTKMFQLKQFVAKRLILLYDKDKIYSKNFITNMLYLLNEKYSIDIKDIITKDNEFQRKELIRLLLKYVFEKQKKEIIKIQIVLEELPLISIKYLINYLSNLISFDSSLSVVENKNEHIFSQNRIINGIPNYLLSYHPYTPLIDDFKKEKNINYNYIKKINENKVGDDKKSNRDTSIKKPSIFEGSYKKLKSKWLIHKKNVWSRMFIIDNENYNKNTLEDFYNWLSIKLKIKTSFNEIKEIANNDLLKSLKNNDLMYEIFEDDSLFNEWAIIIGKKYKTLKMFFDNYFLSTDIKKRKEVLDEIIKKDTLYPNDLYINSISKLLNISILLIHRSKYGTSEKDLERGSVDDLVLSSSYFKAHTDYQLRPLIILNKYTDNVKTIYNVVVEKNDEKSKENDIYIQYNKVPYGVKLLVEEHIKNIK